MKKTSYLEACKLNETTKRDIYYDRAQVLNQVCFDIVYKALYDEDCGLTLEQKACLINLLNKLKCNHRLSLSDYMDARISVFAEGFWNMYGSWYNDDIWKNKRV